MAIAKRNKRRIKHRLLSTIAVPTLVVIFLVVIYLCAGTTVVDATATATDFGKENGKNEHVKSSDPNIHDTHKVSTHVVPISKTATASDYILFPWIVQLVGCCALFMLTKYNSPIPHEAVMFVFGALLGAVSTNSSTHSIIYIQQFHNSISEWINIDSELLLIVFLPGLLFKEAAELPINLLLVALGTVYIGYRDWARLLLWNTIYCCPIF